MKQFCRVCWLVSLVMMTGCVCIYRSDIHSVKANELPRRPDTASWRLAYAHDAAGNRVDGNLQTLIHAVLAGRQVRMVIERHNIAADQDHSFATEAQSLWVKDGVVFGQATQMRESTFKDGHLVLSDHPGQFLFNYSTTGYRDIMLLNAPGGAPPLHISDRVAVKWFVR